MKKIWLLVVLLTIGVLGHLFSMDTTVEPDLGLGYSGNFNLRAGNACDGTAIVYYDKNKKTMAIRVAQQNGGPYYYCYKNENPELYSVVYSFIEKTIDGYSSSDNGRYWIFFWYEIVNGKRIIRGVGSGDN